MQREFTFELRVNFADENKKAAMKTAFMQAARHALAVAELISDGVKPDLRVWSEDFMHGREELDILDDVIAQGTNNIADTGVDMSSDDTISPELLAAVREV